MTVFILKLSFSVIKLSSNNQNFLPGSTAAKTILTDLLIVVSLWQLCGIFFLKAATTCHKPATE